jgi:uncharacterized protein YggL (DUF469 family)
MNRRQRKKRHLGEFIELGFEVRCQYIEPIASDNIDREWDHFIGVIEGLGLSSGGFFGSTGIDVTIHRQRGTTTEADKLEIEKYFATKVKPETYSSSEFFDLWYGGARE